MTIAEEDLEGFYRANRDLVRNFLRRRGVDADLADDLCADVFELACYKLDADHPNPRGWLISAARHLVQSAERNQQREQSAARDYLTLQSHDSPDERLKSLDAAWKELAEQHQEVLRLLFWEQLSGAEAAVALGCSEQAVWKRASRARAELRARWPKSSDEEPEEVRLRERTV